MKLFLLIIGSALLALFVLAVILGLTDIRRYIRINRM
jgi:hypothetical protein